jgi:hypothetical protein
MINHIPARRYITLDQACLKKCGYPPTGAPGNGVLGLPRALQDLLRQAAA